MTTAYYHAHCNDGAMSAAVFKHYTPTVTLIPLNYKEDIPNREILRDEVVFFVDICPPLEMLARVAEVAKFVTVLDHHKSAKDTVFEVNKYPNIVGWYDIAQSGAGLAWKWFFGDKPQPKSVKLIEDWDLWRFAQGDNTKHFHYGIADLHHEPERFLRLLENEELVEEVLRKGQTIYQHVVAQIATTIRANLQIKVWQGYRVAICNTPVFITSEVGNEICETYAVQFALLWGQDHRGVFRCSLRSVGDFDVSEVAAKFGGDGHKNAAGFSVSTWQELGI